MKKLIDWWIESWKETYENPESVGWMSYILQSYQE